MRQNYRGFTLLELLVVVTLIGVLTAVVVAALNIARGRGGDAGVKLNLRNAIGQGEVLYSTRTANKETYTSACFNGIVDGARGVGEFVLAAAKANGFSSYDTNNSAGSATDATCNNSSSAWAAEVPLKSSSGFWCVDSLGKSKQISSSIGAGYACP